VTIALIGLDYHSAILDVREKLTLVQEEVQAELTALCHSHQLDEMLLLATCNRTEVYFATRELAVASEAVISVLAEHLSFDIRPFLYQHEESQAAHHLMRVAAGLESMILGESQILGQVTQALETAQSNKTVGALLSHLFSQAIHAGKRARHESEISRHTTSSSHASVLLLQEKLSIPAEKARVLVIGAGEMARLAGQALRHSGIVQIAIINRSSDHAEELAESLDAEIFAWEALPEALHWADAVISAVTMPRPILSQALLKRVQSERQRPLILMDMGVPRNVEIGARLLPQTQYFDIDVIQSRLDIHLALRKSAIPQVERILEEELARFNLWYQGRQVTPTIIELRKWAQTIAQEELEQALTRLGGNDERTQEIVSLLAHRMMNRFLHEPTTRLRLQAMEGKGDDYAQALRELFALEDTHELRITG
jgi:glutamyl-tRNA reductase